MAESAARPSLGNYHFGKFTASNTGPLTIGNTYTAQHVHYHYHNTEQSELQNGLGSSREAPTIATGSPPSSSSQNALWSRLSEADRVKVKRLLDLSLAHEDSISPAQSRSSLEAVAAVLRHIDPLDSQQNGSYCECLPETLDNIRSIIQLAKYGNHVSSKAHSVGLALQRSSKSEDPDLALKVLFDSTAKYGSKYADSLDPNQSDAPILTYRGRQRRRHVYSVSVARKLSPGEMVSSKHNSLSSKTVQRYLWHYDDFDLEIALEELTRWECALSNAEFFEHKNVSVRIDLLSNTSAYRNRRFSVHVRQQHINQAVTIVAPYIAFHNVRSDRERIFVVAAVGSTNDLIRLITSGQGSLRDCDTEGRSLLNCALCFNNLEIVEFLLNNGADVDAYEPDVFRNNMKRPMLKILCSRSIDMSPVTLTQSLKLLLCHGADPSLTDVSGISATAEIARNSSCEGMKVLLDYGSPFVELNSIGNDSQGLLRLLAVTFSNMSGYQIPDKIAILLQRGAHIDACDKAGNTALHILLQSTNFQHYLKSHRTELYDVLMLLVTAGADVRRRNDRGESPSDRARIHRNWQVWVDVLADYGYDIAEVGCNRDEERQDMSWASGTDCAFHQIRPSLLTFNEYLKIRAARKAKEYAAIFGRYIHEIIDLDECDSEDDENNPVTKEIYEVSDTEEWPEFGDGTEDEEGSASETNEEEKEESAEEISFDHDDSRFSKAKND